MTTLSDAISQISGADLGAVQLADARQLRPSEPRGSLGALDELGGRLAGMAGRCPPPVPARPTAVLFAGDHGGLAAPSGSDEAAGRLGEVLSGRAVVNLVASEVGAAVIAVDVGVATPLSERNEPTPGGPPPGRLVRARVRDQTADVATEPAMGLDEARRAIQVGLTLADRLVDQGIDLLVTGDLSGGGAASSVALAAALTGWPARAVTGRLPDGSEEQWESAVEAVESALGRVAAAHEVAVTALHLLGPDQLLAELGDAEIAGVAGVVLGGALRRVPVVVDGVVALTGALVAIGLAPLAADFLVAGHRSPEPAATAAMEHLGLTPLFDLRLKHGDGVGGCLAVPLVRLAARLLAETALPAGEPATPATTVPAETLGGDAPG